MTQILAARCLCYFTDSANAAIMKPHGICEICRRPTSARIITAMAIVDEDNGRIALLTIYDKQDADTVDLRVIKKMAQELGFAMEGIKSRCLHPLHQD